MEGWRERVRARKPETELRKMRDMMESGKMMEERESVGRRRSEAMREECKKEWADGRGRERAKERRIGSCTEREQMKEEVRKSNERRS